MSQTKIPSWPGSANGISSSSPCSSGSPGLSGSSWSQPVPSSSSSMFKFSSVMLTLSPSSSLSSHSRKWTWLVPQHNWPTCSTHSVIQWDWHTVNKMCWSWGGRPPGGPPGPPNPPNPPNNPVLNDGGLQFLNALQAISNNLANLNQLAPLKAKKIKVRDPDTFDSTDPKKL